MDANIALAALASVLTLVGTLAVQTMRGQSETDAAKVTSQAKLEEHWTDTTLELVDALRAELSSARAELGELRPMLIRLAHLEEALDHIHALLAALRSDEAIEIGAAVKRAQAFLSRMRGDEAKGEARQAVQTSVSAERIVADARAGKIR